MQHKVQAEAHSLVIVSEMSQPLHLASSHSDFFFFVFFDELTHFIAPELVALIVL